MKAFMLSTLFAFMILAVTGLATQKPVLVTYPQGTPESILDQAKDAITAAGGVITHEFNLFRGFAATASANALEMINTLSAEYSPTIEEDSVVTIQGET